MIVAAIGVGLCGTVAMAQTPISLQIPAGDQTQIQAFESSLRAAIVRAGSQLAKRAREVAPNIVLRFEDEARIQDVVLPDGEGLLFFVDVPGIEPNTQLQWQMSRIISSGRGTPTANGANGGGRGSAAFAAPPDPNSLLMTDPPAEYSVFTHDSLVDSMLDSAFGLPLKEGQQLTLVVGDGTSGLPRNPLAEPGRLLYLRIKAEDLQALRQNRITREEAKKRIRQWVY
jgi:hypothetical protein